jgi:hypothetical protein
MRQTFANQLAVIIGIIVVILAVIFGLTQG